MHMWRGQWATYQRWVADQAPQLAPVHELQEEDPRWRPSGWAWRRRGCQVNVPDVTSNRAAWMNPHRPCDGPCVAFIDVVHPAGGLAWDGVCARHIEQAMSHARGWRWAHDATMVAMSSDDDRESWLAMYALGFEA